MKVLVVGGSRFNGYALVQELVRFGHEVTVFNRGVTPVDLPPEVRRLYGDRKNHDQLREVLGNEEFDCVQDMSAYTVDDCQSILEVLRGRLGHYIFVSSGTVYGATKLLPITEDSFLQSGLPQREYGTEKIRCERFLFRYGREHGVSVSTARISLHMGPRTPTAGREQAMFLRLLQGRPILIPGDGTAVTHGGHVFDEAKALRMMMRQPRTFGEAYNITGKQCCSDESYVDIFAQVVGVEPKKVFVPAAIMDDVTPTLRWPLIQRLAPEIHGWRASVFLSIQKLHDDVGWEPDFSFPGAVRQSYEWFLQEGLDKTLAFDFTEEDHLLARIAGQ